MSKHWDIPPNENKEPFKTDENSDLHQGVALTQMYAMALAVVIVVAGAVYWRTSGVAESPSVAMSTDFPDIYTSPLLIDLTDLAVSILPLGARPARASVEGDAVKYIDAYPSTDVVQTKSFNKIKEDIILKQRGHPDAFQYQIDLKSYDFAKDGEGNFIFYQNGHKGDNDFWRFAIPAPFMVDASGKKSSTTDVESSLDDKGLLAIKPSAEWLAGAVYPVTLDPTVEINVVNVHSHPQLGDNWTVDFATRGTADLRIIPNDQATVDDDEFVSLSCNGQNLEPQILAGDVIFYPNWSCSGTSRVVHLTKKAGNHTLRFEFGGQISYAYNSSASSPIIFRAGITTTTATLSATGGTITYTDSNGLNPRSSPAYAGGYTVHTFTGDGTFTVTGSGNVDYLVVGGGGGGGGDAGGGGGAGGYRTATGFPVTAQAYSIVVGGGGAVENKGSDSSFSSITSAGGGSGATGVNKNGGSGGGGRNLTPNGTGTAGQGNDGGAGQQDGNYNSAGGGGGGAGATGSTPGAASVGANGGVGLSSSISGSAVYYAGGGGGGGDTGGGTGGNGGGGNGSTAAGTPTAGAANTGGGGGGGHAGAIGGSGIVIIRYLSSITTITPTFPTIFRAGRAGVAGYSATGGTITYTDSNGQNPRSSPAYAGGYTVHTFTTGGTFSVTGSGNVDYLVIAGGGGGAYGGGGGGGYLTGTTAVTTGDYTITVGDGGNAGRNSGQNSSFGAIAAATGGGGGGDNTNGAGLNGGSGGGGFLPNGSGTQAGGNGTGGQGYGGGAGGSDDTTYRCAGGGGGAGAVGGGCGGSGGNGGTGLNSSISGTSVGYAGGGGGCGSTIPDGCGTASAGFGGGNGSTGGSPDPGTANRGGGGGGKNNNTGAAGGSGVVIIRYKPVDAVVAVQGHPTIFRVPNAAPVNTAVPVVTGTAQVDQTLSCSTGSWTGRPTPTYTYQWQHTTTNITGATNSNYVVEVAYVGETLRCVVTATNSAGNASANSNNTDVVTDVPARSFAISPSVSGKSTWDLDSDGALTLSSYGSWTITPAGSFDASVKMWGAGAAAGSDNTAIGGGGGYGGGTVSFTATGYTLTVGQGGTGTAGNRYGGGGGGGTAILMGATEILIAGGGGGGAGYANDGGAGGGTTGETGFHDQYGDTTNPGTGGGQSSVGSGGTGGAYSGADGSGTNGGAGGTSGATSAGGSGYGNGGAGGYVGGDGGGGGGGGGHKGGGGASGGTGGSGGGGGSGYYNGTYVASPTLTTGSRGTPGNDADGARGTSGNGGATNAANGVDGKIYIY